MPRTLKQHNLNSHIKSYNRSIPAPVGCLKLLYLNVVKFVGETILKQCIISSAEWLQSIQRRDGGWGQYVGDDSNSLNTAESLISLLETNILNPASPCIRKGIDFLINDQASNANCSRLGEYGCWNRHFTEGLSVLSAPDVLRTSLALQALVQSGSPLADDSVRNGLDWLLRNRNSDNGWGFTSDQRTELFPTCSTLQLLVRVQKVALQGDDKPLSADTISEAILDGLECLRKARNSDGSFGLQGLTMPHTLYVIGLLDKARQLVSIIPIAYSSMAEEALDWIKDHRGEALYWVNETIALATGQDKAANYTYSHMTPSLYIKYAYPILLSRLRDKNADPDGGLARDSLIAIQSNQDPSRGCHGFCSKRAVSWATAHSIVALSIAQSEFPTFPGDKRLPNPANDRSILLLFLTLIVLLVFILSVLNKLSGLHLAAFYVIVIISAMAIFNIITRTDFVDLIKSNWPLK